MDAGSSATKKSGGGGRSNRFAGGREKYRIQAAVAALMLLSVIWGYNWVVMKVALRDCGPFMFGAMRTFFGALVLFPVLVAGGKRLAPSNLPGVALLGLLQTAGFVGFMMWALDTGGAGKTAVLVYTMPFWTLVLARVFLHERFRGMQWLAVALALGGLTFVFDPWHPRGNPVSECLALLSGVSWAASVIVAKRLEAARSTDVLALAAWQMLLGSLPLVAIAFIVPGPPISWSGYFVGALVYNVIPCNALAFILWLFIVRNLPAGLAGMGSLVTPLVGVICAWMELGEAPGRIEGIGMLLIGTALLLLLLHALKSRTIPDTVGNAS